MPSKLEPGFAATYSMPRSRRTCTMRSEPGRTAARAFPPAGGRTAPASRSSCGADGAGAGVFDRGAPAGGACCALDSGTCVVIAAAPAAADAAPFRKPRRLTTSFLDFDTVVLLQRSGCLRPRSGRGSQTLSDCPAMAGHYVIEAV